MFPFPLQHQGLRFWKTFSQGSIKSPSETLQDFRQEPRPPLGLVNPDFDQTGGRHVIVFIASLVCRTEIAGQRQIIGVELFEHFSRSNALIVVVLQALMPRDIADRVQGSPSDFASTLGNIIRHAENLLAVFVEQQVIVAKVWPRHVPMEILGLQVQCERIGQQLTQRGGDLGDSFRLKVRSYFVRW
jgi:hypothetical protein